jgi:hypothetical protein
MPMTLTDEQMDHVAGGVLLLVPLPIPAFAATGLGTALWARTR